jgi:hypothetical protein
MGSPSLLDHRLGSLADWEIVSIQETGGHCLCGAAIKWAVTIRHYQSGELRMIGRNCAKKFGFRWSFTTKADYLTTAALMARTDRERDFIKSIQNRLPQWGDNLTISTLQAKWLLDITKHHWRWRLWRVTK